MLRQVSLFLGLVIALPACKTVESNSRPSSVSQAVFAQAAFGLYFFGRDDTFEKAIPGQANRFYDPKKPTYVFIQGWRTNTVLKNMFLSFNNSDISGAPPFNLAHPWLDKGYNVAAMEWTQFADNSKSKGFVGVIPAGYTYDTSERKIWSRDDEGQLTYMLSTGAIKDYPGPNNVAEILAAEYINFMSKQPPERPVRIHGHSLGTQMALEVSRLIWKSIEASDESSRPLLRQIMPNRIALTDTTVSNCPKAWLPSSKPRSRSAMPTCLLASKEGDWIGERLLDTVQDLKKAAGVAVEAYRCWPVSSSGLGADGLRDMNREVAFVEYAPRFTGFKDQSAKHAACAWNYQWSIAFPPPKVINSDQIGISASTPDEVVKAFSESKKRLVHTSGNEEKSDTRQTSSPEDDSYELKDKL